MTKGRITTIGGEKEYSSQSEDGKLSKGLASFKASVEEEVTIKKSLTWDDRLRCSAPLRIHTGPNWYVFHFCLVSHKTFQLVAEFEDRLGIRG